MKRIALSAGFLLSCLLGAGACSNERDVICDVVWSDNADNELGTATITYEALDDVDAGLEECKMDEDSHPDRPDDAVKYSCDCAT